MILTNKEFREKVRWFLELPLVARFDVDAEGETQKLLFVGDVVSSSTGIFLTPTNDRAKAPAAFDVLEELAGFPDDLEIFLYSCDVNADGWLEAKPVEDVSPCAIY